MKRLVCLLLVLAVCTSLFPGVVQAAGTPEISISSGTVKPGETVLLKVSIKDNPGIAAAMVYIYYDTDTFTVDVNRGVTACGSFNNDGNVLCNTIAKAKENGRYDGSGKKDGMLAVWYNGSAANTDGDGAFLTVKLEANANAANGDYGIEVACSDSNTCNAEGEYLRMRAGSGTVTVTGSTTEKQPEAEKPDEEVPGLSPEELVAIPVAEFTDVAGNWAENYIDQAAERRLIEGYMGKYRPNDTMTRAEFVTILWRAMGRPEPTKATSFKDLTQDWYKDAVAWAEEHTVVNGMSEGVFGPDGNVTREQMVTIFHRMAGTPVSMEAMFASIYDAQYLDSSSIGDWAKSALYWSIYNGIYCGTDSEKIGSRLEPKLPATRAQIAVMIVRYLDMSE